ncbi:hypothetical protein MRX96_022710 [Rhipicephalus microplus]
MRVPSTPDHGSVYRCTCALAESAASVPVVCSLVADAKFCDAVCEPSAMKSAGGLSLVSSGFNYGLAPLPSRAPLRAPIADVLGLFSSMPHICPDSSPWLQLPSRSPSLECSLVKPLYFVRPPLWLGPKEKPRGVRDPVSFADVTGCILLSLVAESGAFF